MQLQIRPRISQSCPFPSKGLPGQFLVLSVQSQFQGIFGTPLQRIRSLVIACKPDQLQNDFPHGVDRWRVHAGNAVTLLRGGPDRSAYLQSLREIGRN